MNRQEMLTEIRTLKMKMAFGACGAIEQGQLLTALLALYESVLALDNKIMVEAEDALLNEWHSLLNASDSDEGQLAA